MRLPDDFVKVHHSTNNSTATQICIRELKMIVQNLAKNFELAPRQPYDRPLSVSLQKMLESAKI